MAPIPTTERSPELRPIVFELYGKFAHLIMEGKARAQIVPLRYLLQPWFEENERVEGQQVQSMRDQILRLGIDGAAYVGRLKQVLEFDNHLRQCCGWVPPLIDHIDRNLGTTLLVNLIGDGHLEEAERNWSDFLDVTYAGPLKRYSYTHLFNLTTDQAPFPLGNARVERLDRLSLAGILGETLSAVDFFHRPAESEYFLVFEEGGWNADPREWIRVKQREANEIIFLLQLFKPGVVHATYTVPHFSPTWVSSLWSRIISPTYLGTFRGGSFKDGEAPYVLNGQEIEDLNNWARFFLSSGLKAKLSTGIDGFGQMFLRSARYYRSSLSRETAPERLVDLAIALESMFTPASAHTELTFRISQNVSQLVGEDASSRKKISKLVKRLYERRSALLHGQYDYAKFARGEFVSDDELDQWTDVIRMAILRMAVLYSGGETDREGFLAKLSSAALDQTIGEQVRRKSNPELFRVRIEHFHEDCGEPRLPPEPISIVEPPLTPHPDKAASPTP